MKVRNTAPGAGDSIESLRPFQHENGYDIANDSVLTLSGEFFVDHKDEILSLVHNIRSTRKPASIQ